MFFLPTTFLWMGTFKAYSWQGKHPAHCLISLALSYCLLLFLIAVISKPSSLLVLCLHAWPQNLYTF